MALAYDITQITSDPYNYTYAAHTTRYELENKWKISTNKSKFTIVPLTRNNIADIHLGDDHYPYTNKEETLKINLSYVGIHNQINIR